jgi:XTP/dITP diphosphohydrolase
LLEFPLAVPLKEVMGTFEKNAAAKAVSFANFLQLPVIADDSGLVVPVLGDHSESFRRKMQREQGKKLPDTKKLLSDLRDKSELERGAFLECALAFALPKIGCVKVVSARIEGTIALQEHGPASFDFASVFMKHEYSKTLAEIPPAALSRISHRRRACEMLAPVLRLHFAPSRRMSTSVSE